MTYADHERSRFTTSCGSRSQCCRRLHNVVDVSVVVDGSEVVVGAGSGVATVPMPGMYVGVASNSQHLQ